MSRWTAVAIALRRPSDDQLQSRLSTYLHPVAGRSLVWHVMSAITAGSPRPLQLLLVSGDPSLAAGLDDIRVETVFPARGAPWAGRTADRLHPSATRVLVVDAAAAALGPSLRRLIGGPPGRALFAEDGSPVAAWLERKRFVEAARSAPDLAALAQGCEPVDAEADDVFVVRDRLALARAGQPVRDRLVAKLMADGATFLLPETVLVDVDVRVGQDTLVYPGVVLEGQTVIGSETVIGPGCRIVDTRIGSGVELKGWNFLVNTSVRNRAVLEPYVRRGFD